MNLSIEQLSTVNRLAAENSAWKLPDLAEKWNLETKYLIRAFTAERQRIDAQSRREPQPPIKPLTPEQIGTVRTLAQDGRSAALIGLAENWGVPSQTLSRLYSDCREEMRREPPITSALQHARPVIKPQLQEVSPVAGVTAEAGAIAVMPRNWVLTSARFNSGKSEREVAWAVGMSYYDYRRLESGRHLPTADQSARISALFGIPIKNLFAMAAEDPVQGSAGIIRGLSVLGLLRCRRRMSAQQLAEAVRTATEVKVTSSFIGSVERGTYQQPLSDGHARMLDAIAVYLELPPHLLLQQVPPAFLTRASQATAHLHDALKASFLQIQHPEPVTAFLEAGEQAE